VGKVGHGDQGAAWKLSVGKHFVPDFDESVAVSRIVDRDRHGDQIGKLAADAIERSVDEREASTGLSLEIVRDRFSVQIGEGCLSGKPDNFATLRDHGRRESARFLKICAFQMGYSSVRCHWLNSLFVAVTAAQQLHGLAEFPALVDPTYATAFADPKI
jgi:hypothetical protein